MLYAGAVALAAWAARLLTWDGAIAAAVVGGLFWEAGGWKWAVPIVIFFATSTALSRLGTALKAAASLDVSPRGAAQVFANGGPSAACVALYMSDPSQAIATAAVAGIAAANADTWATEVGTWLGKRFFRITTLAPAYRGSSGAVSAHGLIAAFCGSALIAACLPLVSTAALLGPVSVIGFAASVLDSLLGDTLQRGLERRGKRSKLTNSVVNFVAVSAATLAGYFAAA